MKKFVSKFGANPIHKEYEIGRQCGSAGPSLLWRVHEATHKTRNERASVFLFDKKAVTADKAVPKARREELFSVLRAGPTQLQKLRHPAILKVMFPLSESKDLMAFATEPCFASLANVLGQVDNLQPVPLVVRNHELDELEVAMGTIELCDALAFCSTAEIIHGNLSPEHVMLTDSQRWKLIGFEFYKHTRYQTDAGGFEFPEYTNESMSNSMLRALKPNLNFLAPEYILTKNCDPSSDVYSLSHLIFACFNHGSVLFESHGNILNYKQNIERISRLRIDELKGVPGALRELVKVMMNAHGSVRPAAEDVTRAPFFDQLSIMTLRFLMSLVEKEDQKKAQFMQSLPRVLPTLPPRLLHHRVLPALFAECKNKIMIPFVLPNILQIAEDCSITEYETRILPQLIPLFAIRDPIQVLQIFLQKMSLLLTKTPADKVHDHVLPMIYCALEATEPAIQKLIFSILPTFMHTIQYTAMKHNVIPRIQALVLQSRDPQLRISGLVCLGKLMEVMDKWLYLDSMLPMLESLHPPWEPGILMAILGVLTQGLKDRQKFGFDAELVATRILPFVMPLSIDPCLNGKQFARFMKAARDMVDFLDSAQAEKLKSLEQMEQATSSTVGLASDPAGSGSLASMEQMMANEQSAPRLDVKAALAAAESTPSPFDSGMPAPAPRAAAAPAPKSDDLLFDLMGATTSASSSDPTGMAQALGASRPAASASSGGYSSSGSATSTSTARLPAASLQPAPLPTIPLMPMAAAAGPTPMPVSTMPIIPLMPTKAAAAPAAPAPHRPMMASSSALPTMPGSGGMSRSSSAGSGGSYGLQPTSTSNGIFASGPAASGSSVFGSSAPATGGSVFGASAPAPAMGGDVFGGSVPMAGGMAGTLQPTVSSAGSVFGAPAAPAMGGSVFGGSAPAATSGSVFGGGGGAGLPSMGGMMQPMAPNMGMGGAANGAFQQPQSTGSVPWGSMTPTPAPAPTQPPSMADFKSLL